MEPNVPDEFPYLVLLYSDRACRRFMGSGLLIGPRHVLSCAHVFENAPVAEKSTTWFAKLYNGRVVEVVGNPVFTEKPRELHEDIALFYLREAVCEVGAPLVYRLPRTYWEPGHQPKYFTLGQKGLTPHKRTLGEFIGNGALSDGTFLDAQAFGGIPDGYSGGPIVCFQHDEWWCVGIACLGGDGKATSSVITSDALFDFLRQREDQLNAEGLHLAPPQFREASDWDASQQPPAPPVKRGLSRSPWYEKIVGMFRGVRATLFGRRAKVTKTGVGSLIHRYCQAWREILANPARADKWTIFQMRLDCYVWPRLSWEQPARVIGAEPTKRIEIPGEGIDATRRMITELLDKRRVVLYDDAGMGKTAFTHKCFELLLTEAHWDEWFRGAPPLVVRIEGLWPLQKATISTEVKSRPAHRPRLTVRELLITQVMERLQSDSAVANAPNSTGDLESAVALEVAAALADKRVVVFVDAFDQMTQDDRQHVDRILGEPAPGMDAPDRDVGGCAWLLTGRAYAIRPFEKHFPPQTRQLRLERFSEAEQDAYFVDLAKKKFFQHPAAKPLDWICQPRSNLKEDLGLPLNLREVRTLIETCLEQAGSSIERDDRLWSERRIATTGQLHALVAKVLLERALRHLDQRNQATRAPRHSGAPSSDDRKLLLLTRVCGLLGLQMMLEANYNASVEITQRRPDTPDDQDGVQAFLERARQRFLAASTPEPSFAESPEVGTPSVVL